MSAPEPSAIQPPGALRALLLLLWREAMAERRTLGWAGSAGLLALQQVIVLGFGFSNQGDSPARRALAIAAMWLAFLFCGAVGIGRSFSGEQAGGALAGVLLMPVHRWVVYLSKVITGAVFMAAALAVMLVSGRLFLGFGPEVLSAPMFALVSLTAVGYLAPGVLVGGMMSQMRGRDALLAVALLPLMVPVFLGATGAAQTIAIGGGFADVQNELVLIGSFASLYLAGGVALFGRVVD